MLKSLLFQLVAFKIYSVIKKVYCIVSIGCLVHLLGAVTERCSLKFQTSLNMDILMKYLLKISLTHFIALVSFYTPRNKSENQRFPDVFMRHRKTPV